MMMKTLVVYDSQFGNTQKVAKIVAKTLKAQIINVRNFEISALKEVALLVVGSPIQAWNPTIATNNFLASLPANYLKGTKVAAFDTRIKIFISGDAAGKIDKRLVELGGNSISTPGKFYVLGKEGPLSPGELEKAEIWAKQIINEF